MDPFNSLYASTTPLIEQLSSTSPQSLDFLTLQNEIVSCIHDLEESVKVVESNNANILDNPFGEISQDEIAQRKMQIQSLHESLNKILVEKNVSTLKGAYGANPFADNMKTHTTTTVSNSNEDQDPPELDSATREYHQQLLQQQDDLISNELSNSINNLHQQAVTIGDELDYQHDLLDQVENNMERLNFKIVNTGMKRINKFLATNEMGGNCCIAVLIVVLIIILVLLIIA
ncbi:hypothetical protein PMKS-002833 [Pichia membranifaciens]|uniref:t-SNARE coiled-coil homology domain-containing protein n=1 Tax=Pichia membranifaciens TaxID=4926 RepID=A0A1Q2YIP7_9ASCO|nr:hypothetical protein PMKS-002833 [Pichia membranifaciens]